MPPIRRGCGSCTTTAPRVSTSCRNCLEPASRCSTTTTTATSTSTWCRTHRSTAIAAAHAGIGCSATTALVDGMPHFTDVTAQAGVGLQAYGMGVAVGDVDNDGFQDLFVTAFGPERALPQPRRRHLRGRHGARRRRRSALEHQRGVPRLRSGRRPRPLRRELRRLHGSRQQGVHRSGRRARLLPTRRLHAASPASVPERGRPDVHRCDGILRRRPRIRRRAWASRSATSTSMGGPTSTWPTMRRRTSYG